MGFFRGGLLITVSILLFLSLLLGNILLILSLSLQYDNVKEGLTPLAQEFAEDKLNLIGENFNLTEEMEEAREFMKDHCQNATEYVFSEGGYTFVVPCDIINESSEVFVEQGVDSIIEQVYYKEYDCDFWNCFSQDELPLFLISEKAKDYWKAKFYFSIIASLILVVLLFFLVEQKPNFPILVGALLVLSSLPLLRLENLSSVISGQSYLEFISFFFNSSGGVFWSLFIVGLIILGLGISWRLLSLGSLKKKFSKKEVRQIVKGEMQKDKKK